MGDVEFIGSIEAAAGLLKSQDRCEVIKIISHLDADGLCACSVLVKALSNENRRFSISILPQLDRKAVEEFACQPNKFFIFSDLGSGQLELIKKSLGDRKIIILDHHDVRDSGQNGNICHINPHLFGINGSRDISGAGVAFLFAKALDKKNKNLAHLAIIGAIGDNQEKHGFTGLNNSILEIAQNSGRISVEQGLRLFGAQTRPLHKLLEFSFYPYIPGVSGSESGAINLLQSLDINPKKGTSWKKLADLTSDEKKRLIEGLVLQRIGQDSPEDIIGPVYSLPHEEDAMFSDAREFATLLNACGRLNRASVGIGVCMGDKESRQSAKNVLQDYRKEIMCAIRWYESSRKSSKEKNYEKNNENNNEKNNENNGTVLAEKGYIIINGGEELLPTMAGTLASILSRSNDIEEGTYIMSMARADNNMTKVSLRISGNKHDADLRKVLSYLISKTGGESGGHMNAAGAIIPSEKEPALIELSRSYFNNKAIEEKI
jgi:single-stranded-DNA-specific exonuclease